MEKEKINSVTIEKNGQHENYYGDLFRMRRIYNNKIVNKSVKYALMGLVAAFSAFGVSAYISFTLFCITGGVIVLGILAPSVIRLIVNENEETIQSKALIKIAEIYDHIFAKIDQRIKNKVLEKGLIVEEGDKRIRVPFEPTDYENLNNYGIIKGEAMALYDIHLDPTLCDLIINGNLAMPRDMEKFDCKELSSFVADRLSVKKEMEKTKEEIDEIELAAHKVAEEINLRDPAKRENVQHLASLLNKRVIALIPEEKNRQALAALQEKYDALLEQYVTTQLHSEELKENFQYSMGNGIKDNK